ncbi:hypothetical protein GQ457_17G018570 [Hibiscus cannabinus]
MVWELCFEFVQVQSDCAANVSIKTKGPSTINNSTWPRQFHSLLFMNNSGTLQKVHLGYECDWPNRHSFNIIQKQLGKLTYDLKWDTGTWMLVFSDNGKMGSFAMCGRKSTSFGTMKMSSLRDLFTGPFTLEFVRNIEQTGIAHNDVWDPWKIIMPISSTSISEKKEESEQLTQLYR